MAVELINWAIKQTAGSAANKAVLIALCNHANKQGECWPSQKCIQEFTELSIRTIQRALTALEDGGFIKREERRRKDGYRTSDLYKIIYNDNISCDTVSHDTMSGDTQSGDTVTDLTRHCDRSQATQCQGYIIEPPYEPPLEPPLYSFEEFWKEWMPYKTGKGSKKDAQVEYLKALKTIDHESLLNSSCEYINFCKQTDCPTKHVFRWLKKNGWDDEHLVLQPTLAIQNNLTQTKGLSPDEECRQYLDNLRD